MNKKRLSFEAEHAESQQVRWLEPSTGKTETGLWIAESNLRGWIIVIWNGKRWMVDKKSVKN
jgi:hypothetical protein